MQDIYNHITALSSHLINNKACMMEILSEVETVRTAEDEISRVLSLLSNFQKQERYIINNKVKGIASYLPLNQPLYSYFLFAIVPSFISHKIFVRPPVLLQKTFKKIYAFFNQIINNIEVLCISRKAFEPFFQTSDVIIYTGKLRNAMDLVNRLTREQLFLFNGNGANYCIVSDSANLDIACNKIIDAQLYNSGQDCMAPLFSLVSQNIFDKFCTLLKEKLKKLTVGENNSIASDIGPLVSKEIFDTAVNYIQINNANVIFGGEVNGEKRIIYPTIIKRCEINYSELYSPIFNLFLYHHDNELEKIITAMNTTTAYVSIFGKINEQLYGKFNDVLVLKDKNINDIEEGNEPFGGYNKCNSFVCSKGEIACRPILILKEIYGFCR